MKTVRTYSPKTKILSLILSILIIFYLIPTSVFAEGLDNDTTVSNNSVSANEENNTYTPEIYEVTELREDNVKHFRLPDGSYVAAQYNYPVHYTDENGQLVDIDNRLSESGSELSTGNSRIKFVKKITRNGNIFTLHENNTKITMGLVGAEKKTQGVVASTNNSDDAIEDALGKMTNLENISSTILYEDILDGVDIEYIVYSLNIKENIIVKERKDNYSYTFTLEINNLVAELSDDRNVYIRSADGEVQYVIPAPVVFDSNGNYAPTDAAAYTLNSSGNGKYNLTVSVLSEWMNDESRVFPITVDPPILGTSDCDIDLNIDSNYPNSNTNGNEEFYVSSTERAYLKFDESSFAVFPTGSTIMRAELNIIGSNLSGAPAKIGVYEITSNWDNSITWNKSIASPTQGSFSSELIDYIVVNSTGRHSWNITELYKGWIDGEVNNGLGLRLVDESATNERSYFTSWEYCPPGDDVNYYGPVIMVTYIYNDGLEDYYPTATHSAGVGGVGSIKLSTGKMVLAIPTLTTTDSLFGFTPTLVYNSSLAGKYVTSAHTASAFSTSYVGYGFKLNLCETIVKSQYKDADGITHNYYLLYDADGTVHRFYSSGNTTVYNDDDGLQLTLTINNSSIEIKDKSQTTKIYSAIDSSSWYLTQIKDKNNNSLIFEYNPNYKPTRVLVQPNGLSSIEMLRFIYNGNMLGAVYNDSSKDSVVFRYSGNYLSSIEYYAGDSNTTEQDVWERAQDEELGRYLYLFCTAEYVYDSNGYITEITDGNTNESISYEITNGKITKISEYAGTTLGQQVSYTYHDGYTDVSSTGNDETLNTTDDIITRYIFDSYGRAVSVYSMSVDGSEIYGATMGAYETTEKAKNSLKEMAVVYDNLENYLENNSGDYYAILQGGVNKTAETGCFKQTIFEETNVETVTYNANKKYIVSGFGYSNSIIQNNASKFSLSVNIYYYQGEGIDDIVETMHFDFADVENTWQFTSGTVDCNIGTDGSTEYNIVRKIEVVCNYYGQININGSASYAYFNKVAFTECSDGDAYKYDYDSNGNLIAKIGAQSAEYYEYDEENRIIRITNNFGHICEYDYNETENGSTEYQHYSIVTESGSSELIFTNSYSYNQYGLLIFTGCIGSGDYSSKILSYSYGYETEENSKIFGALTQKMDSSGNIITYYYNSSNGNLISQTDSSTNTGYYYTYDNMGRLEAVRPANSIVTFVENAENVNYSYNSAGYLSSITTDSTTYTLSYDEFGNSIGTTAGNNTLATYEYYSNNGKLKKINYGNGFSEEYVYNTLEMLSEIWYTYDDGTREKAFSYTYNVDGTLDVFTDHRTNKNVRYTYDTSGKLESIGEKDIAEAYYNSFYRAGYDDESRVSLQTNIITTSEYSKLLTTLYDYYGNGNLSSETLTYLSDSHKINYIYDYLGRISEVNSEFGTLELTEQYTYISDDSNTSNLVGSYTHTIGTSSQTYNYTYDSKGNITKITKGSNEKTYNYDDLGQLVREYTEKVTKTYTYDNAGNITSIQTVTIKSGDNDLITYGISPTIPPISITKTATLSYSNSEWGDLLTSYDDTAITYDAIGNPLSYYNGTAYTFTWEGRRLVGAVKGTNTMSFTYNDSGIRTSKTVNGVVHKYYLNGSQIVAEQWGDKLNIYLYDTSGSPIGMMYRTTAYAENTFDLFWFEKNLQGDIVAVYDNNGEQIITYNYADAWGNHNPIYTTAGFSSGAKYNPFRYRGYYYDTDLEMYYLQSRYYDAKICRFINADSALYHSMLGYNLFAYCGNNPVTRIDPTGEFFELNDIVGDEFTLEGAGAGGYGASGNYFGYGTAYHNYSVYSATSAYNAYLGGYYYSGGGSLGGYTAQFAVGSVSVTDSMATTGISRITSVCFVVGTIVKAAEGDVPIENIQVGDYVYAHNPETGETELKPVVNTFVNEATELVHIFADGEEIICTNEHPFYSPVKGWIEACKLRAGDILVSLNGEYIVVEQVQHEILESPIKVYNFEVEDFHTYFVGDGNGVLVHNSCNHNSAWNTERRNYWKQRATTDELDHDYGAYKATANNIERMRNGLAPKGWDGQSVQLHHPNGIANDFYYYYPVSRTFHIFLHGKE